MMVKNKQSKSIQEQIREVVAQEVYRATGQGEGNMIIKTETEISHLSQLEYYPLSKLRIEMLRMEEMLENSGQKILEKFQYVKLDKPITIIGIKSEGTWELGKGDERK